MKKDFEIKRITDKIYLLNFKSEYLLAMHFLRYQERYESPSKKFRNKNFEILDFMEWYQAEYGKKMFTYPRDWGGFNVPSHIFHEQFEDGIIDENRYDRAMEDAFVSMNKESGHDFYVIGAVGASGHIVNHEIAHGLFYTDPIYQREAKALIKQLPNGPKHGITRYLLEIGYCGPVIVDEIQAYMSTGLPTLMDARSGKALEKRRKPFQDLFKSASENSKM